MQRNHTLDGIRGVAALSVVLFHAERLTATAIAPHGYLAVDLFFVLSGFVVAKAYDQRFRDGLSWPQFSLFRALRFFPLYALGLGLGAIVEVGRIVQHSDFALSPAEFAGALAFGGLFIPFPVREGTLFPLNIPAWSLFFELLVNALYCATFAFWTKSRLLWLMTVSGIVLFAGIIYAGSLDQGAKIEEFPLASVRTIFSFGCGVLLTKIDIGLPALPGLALLALTGLLLMIPHVGVWFDLVFVFVLSPLIIALGVKAHEHNATIPLLAYFGAISFPIYAIHRPIFTLLEALAKRLPVSPLLLGVVCTAGLLLVCPLLTRFVDRSAARRLRKTGLT